MALFYSFLMSALKSRCILEDTVYEVDFESYGIID